MANMCNFNMCIKGEHENIEKFYNAMSQKGTVWMGRGAEADIRYEGDDTAFINGWCKWSVRASLVLNAISMRTHPEKWYQLDTSYEYITLWEACEKWNLIMEVYSEESGCCFQEHYMYDNGAILDETEDWYEYYLCDFDTKEEAEKELGIKITDDEWNNEEFISRCGFESWEFMI